MLHISGVGLLKYMFASLECLISLTRSKKRDQESFDDLHHCIVIDAQRQRERDFPRMSVPNGITDGSKMCGSEQVGNCFAFFCAMYTQLEKNLLAKEMGERGISWQKFMNCLKLYLAFERWVTESHPQSQICKSITLLNDCPCKGCVDVLQNITIGYELFKQFWIWTNGLNMIKSIDRDIVS